MNSIHTRLQRLFISGALLALLMLAGTGYAIDSLPLRLLTDGVLLLLLALLGTRTTFSVVSERLQRQHRELVHQALHDALTDLPNRHLLYNRLDQGLQLAVNQGGQLALLVMDLDRFKEVNDTLGHHQGDLLLKEVSRKVAGLMNKDMTVARLGGDEFGIVLPDTDTDSATAVARRILMALEQQISIEGVQLEAKPSIGIALFPQHGGDTETLLQRADVAMYQAKHNKLGYCIYEETHNPHSRRRLQLITDLRAAIQSDQLMLHYQPKVDLHSGRTTGAEALVRWHHPDLGTLGPEEFVELAEEHGLINLMTDWVLGEAIHQCRQWQNQGIDITIAVNLSPHNLHEPGFLDKLREMLELASIDASQIELELTETAMMTDMNHAMEVFRELSAMGFRLAIDDFGTGMSSLSYLKRLPVDELKIDKSFVTDMAEDENNAVLVRSIIDLAHNIGRRVVAEGVQDRDALELLEMLGCDVAQGYYLSRPRSAADLVEWLHDSSYGVRTMRERLRAVS